MIELMHQAWWIGFTFGLAAGALCTSVLGALLLRGARKHLTETGDLLKRAGVCLEAAKADQALMHRAKLRGVSGAVWSPPTPEG